nr:uncharacterized protein CFP56_16502 [Quercus suber]POF04891.1 uncharacterized protein CFP56_73852 [Quercus suber]
MPNDNSSLYGLSRPRNLANGKEISSSTTLAFTSQLSSLISSSNSAPSTHRPHKRPAKPDIFATHNRDAAKRAKLDLVPSAADAQHAAAQRHSTHSAAVDAGLLARSRRKMEEKARLYAAMQRGDVADEDGRFGVDFDRKWAEAQARRGGHAELEEQDDDDDDDEGDSGDESGAESSRLVEFVDEFGRTRTGSARQAADAQRAKRAGDSLAETTAEARPAAPSRVIYGDAIQHNAFNPEERVSTAMEALAAKRDRSLTPPPEEHFDGKREVRTKGTGFFQFSGEEGERRAQMEGLERERAETERKRAERRKVVEERRKMVEERRREISGKWGKRQAEEFLADLEAEMVQKGIGQQQQSGSGGQMMDRIHAAVAQEEENGD